MNNHQYQKSLWSYSEKSRVRCVLFKGKKLNKTKRKSLSVPSFESAEPANQNLYPGCLLLLVHFYFLEKVLQYKNFSRH